MEIWHSIEGYEGVYQISSLGRVKRLISNRCLKERILKPNTVRDGYQAVKLCKDSLKKVFVIHRLVARAFIQNPQAKPFINHIDGNTSNNCISNLEWCTQSENIIHSYKRGRIAQHGQDRPNAKYSDDIIREVRLKRSMGLSCHKIAEEYNMSHQYVSAISNRLVWKHVS
jgi:hypothetical protein